MDSNMIPDEVIVLIYLYFIMDFPLWGFALIIMHSTHPMHSLNISDHF